MPDYQKACELLANVDADWARLIGTVGPCTHTPQPACEPYEALMRAVAKQQLNGLAAPSLIQNR